MMISSNIFIVKYIFADAISTLRCMLIYHPISDVSNCLNKRVVLLHNNCYLLALLQCNWFIVGNLLKTVTVKVDSIVSYYIIDLFQGNFVDT